MVDVKSHLKEHRIHGDASFPCAYYLAKDSDVGGPLDVPYHWHESLEIIYLEKGKYIYHINMEVSEIKEPCFLLIDSGSLHRLYAEGEYVEQAVVFAPEMLSFVLNDRSEDRILRPLISGQSHFPNKIKVEDPLFEAFQTEYRTIAKTFQLENVRHGDQHNVIHAFSQLTVKTSLLKMMGLLYENDRFQMDGISRDEMTEIMKKVLIYMEEHYMNPIRLEDFADVAGLNPQYFCRQFKKFSGESPMKYLLHYRLRRAGQMLASTTLTVTDIAFECGFHNLGHFMTEFRKMMGMTPNSYRKERQKK